MSRSLASITYDYLSRVTLQLRTYSHTFPKGPRRTLAKQLATIFEDTLKQFESLFETSRDQERVDLACRHLNETATSLVSFFYSIFEAPDTPSIPTNLTLPILRITPPDTQYIGLLPSVYEINFCTQMFTLRHVRNVLSLPPATLEAASSDTPTNHEPLRFFVSYPQQLGDDLLSLTVLGHELAHVWYDRFEISELISPAIKMDPEQLRERANKSANDAAEYFKKMQAMASAWTEEVACDLAAIHVTGPVNLFAFNRIVQLAGGHQVGSSTHPDSSWRCRVMFNKLIQMGYLTNSQSGVPKVAPRISEKLPGCAQQLSEIISTNRERVIRPDPDEAIVYDAIRAGLTRITEVVNSKICIPTLLMDEALVEIVDLVSRFEKGHVLSDRWINGTNCAIDERLLLVSLWETYLRQSHDHNLRLPELNTYISDLVNQFARAISSAEILALWKQPDRGDTS